MSSADHSILKDLVTIHPDPDTVTQSCHNQTHQLSYNYPPTPCLRAEQPTPITSGNNLIPGGLLSRAHSTSPENLQHRSSFEPITVSSSPSVAPGKIDQILYIREGIQEAVPVDTDRTKKLKIISKQTNLPKAFALSLFPVKFLFAVPNSDEDIEISRILG